MIEDKQQALAFLHNKDNEAHGKHRWHNHTTFKAWIDEMLDEIFTQTQDVNVEQDTQMLKKKFGLKAMQELGAMCIGTTIGIDTVAGFVKYRNEIKKPLKTARPLKQYINELKYNKYFKIIICYIININSW